MFELKMKTGNAAFQETDAGNEIARILDENVISLLLLGATRGKCIDINGNTVGEWKLEE